MFNIFIDAKQRDSKTLPEVAEYYLLTQQLNILPQVEALEDELVANDLLAVNKSKVKFVKNKAKRHTELKTK